MRFCSVAKWLFLAVVAGCSTTPVLNDAPVEVASAEVPRYWQPVQGSFTFRAPPGRKHPDQPVRVVIGYLIDSEGQVHNAEVLESEPKGVFDRAALRSVRQLEFEPSPSNDNHQPIRTRMVIRLNPG